MTPGQFLRTVWPAQGHYCIAHPFRLPGVDTTLYWHRVFPTIGEAVTHIHTEMHARDTFFAVLSLTEPRVWNADKVNPKTQEIGKWQTRVAPNMAWARSSFFDLDVGAEAHKYPSQQAAREALAQFVAAVQLPVPFELSSGGGVHCYWPWVEEIPAAEWATIATHMRQLAEVHKLRVDPMRTTDSTSVLRVPGTFNRKDPDNPREVTILHEGEITPVETFRRLLSDALVRSGTEARSVPLPAAAPASATPFGASNVDLHDWGPPPTLQEVTDACASMDQCIRSQLDPTDPHFGKLDQTAWYRGLIGVVKHVENGDDLARQLTARFPRTVSNVEAKLEQAAKYPPARCTTLQEYMPWKDGPCQSCKFLSDPSVPNPIAAARRSTEAPPPVIQLQAPPLALGALSVPAAPTTVPNPPKPFSRLASGGVAVDTKDASGNVGQRMILPYDLYPVSRMVNSDASTEQHLWRAVLPRSGSKDFTIDADVLYDSRKFCAALAHSGIYPSNSNIPHVRDYMVAYISQLQKQNDADSQSGHLGWTDDYRRFVLPDKVLAAGSRVLNSTLTPAAARATQFISRKGDLATQVRLMDFYRDPAYIPNQFVILAGLGSILLHMTGQYGLVVNMSGESGASKSTTLMATAGEWGDPVLWPLNGTNRGATANARSGRVLTNANLPTCVDEITYIPIRELQDLVLSISQPGQRVRLQTDGVERSTTNSYKSAIMISSANTELHALLSQDNAAGTAGSMRVFEIRFNAQRVHTKAEADEFLRQIKDNYGWIGEVFAAFVVDNYAAVAQRVQDVVREIDREAQIQSSERYWSAVVAVAIVVAEICQALGLLPYNALDIRQWALRSQIPYMRGVVKEEYQTPISILTNYIAQASGNIIVVERSGSLGANVGQQAGPNQDIAKNRPHGALLGHHDVVNGVLYLLKSGFKEHCSKIGAVASRVVEELHQPRLCADNVPRRVVVDKNARRVLGGGTDLAKGQAYCYVIDMKHPEVSGVVPLGLVTPLGAALPVSTSAPAGNLRAV